jgi:hypothetical protein
MAKKIKRRVKKAEETGQPPLRDDAQFMVHRPGRKTVMGVRAYYDDGTKELHIYSFPLIQQDMTLPELRAFLKEKEEQGFKSGESKKGSEKLFTLLHPRIPLSHQEFVDIAIKWIDDNQ